MAPLQLDVDLLPRVLRLTLECNQLVVGRNDPSDDGRGSENDGEKVNEEQLEKIKAVLNDNGVTEKRLLNYLRLLTNITI